MKKPTVDQQIMKRSTQLTGRDALEFYTLTIIYQLEAMMNHVGNLETALIEMKKHLPKDSNGFK
jgi:hypothetical protein